MSFTTRVSRRFRAVRMERFVRDFAVTAGTTVLDVGGTPSNWELIPVQPRLTILNTPRATESAPAGIAWVAGDGCRLPFADASFDIVFSNSVIEHLGSSERQREFAREVMRVGRSYFVQTPNRWFPVETHLLTPLIHYLPKRWQAPVVRRCTVWQMMTGTTGERRDYFIGHYLDEIVLLGSSSLRRLFPGARIEQERFCGIAKSLIAKSVRAQDSR